MEKGMIDVQLLATDLSSAACEAFVRSDAAGGVVVFVGNVRNQTQQKKVLRLHFEAYRPMAISEMQKIAYRAVADFGALKVAIHHREGTLQVGQTAVVIAVAAPHRKAAFDACAFAIDTLKETVPIWKKEYFEDGQVWVAAHP